MKAIGASLEALGAEALGLVEGLLLNLADAIADALVRPIWGGFLFFAFYYCSCYSC